MIRYGKIWLPLCMCACALLIFSSRAQAALGWIGNMSPAEGSLTGAPIGGDFTVTVEVGKDNVTDAAGQGAGITCTMRLGTVTDWGGNQSNLGDIPMSYDSDAGDHDKYTVTYSRPEGKYEFVCFCTDNDGSLWVSNNERARLLIPATCGGIRSDNASVCGGHGTCEGMDTCQCAGGWEGTNCETPLPVCNGIRSDNASVCSGHGTCEATDTCQCADGWTGQNCASPVPATTTSVPAATTTVAPTTTTTPPTTTILVTCGGIASDNASVCSGHGTCAATDTCQCAEGWTGQYCASPVSGTTTVPATTTIIAPTSSSTAPTTVPATTTVAPATSTTTTSTGGPACPAGKVLGENDPRLENLRDFRDSVLAKSTLGRALVRIYYDNAGSLNAALDRSPALKSFAGKALTGLIGKK